MEVHDSMSALFMKEKSQQFTDTFQNKVNVYCFNIFLNSPDGVIMSRSLIDSIAMNVKEKDQAYIESLVDDSIRDTDYYFYLPVEFKISQREDGLRELDPAYQRSIDEKIRKTFHRYPSKNKFEISGSIEDRLTQILTVVK